MKRVPVYILLLVGAGAILLLARTLAVGSKQIDVESREAVVRVDSSAAAERLAQALRFETISYGDPARFDRQAFRDLHAHIESSFPGVHRELEREYISELSLLYTWPGSDPSLPPIVLMSHLDVVPVAKGTPWQHPPFAGAIADGFIWGRGALDDKFGVLGILEAVELLLADGYAPRRTVYLFFGHDEEVGGERGAQVAAETLMARGVRAGLVLDEGGAITRGVLPGLERPVAVVGIAEKGSITLELRIEAAGGHSSTPPAQTAIGELATAIHRLEANPMPKALRGPTLEFFRYVGPELGLVERIAFANLWLFSGVIEDQLAASAATNASMRTTTAVTVFNGGVRSNVLPPSARAVVNFRIFPGDTIADVISHVEETIDNPSISIEQLGTAREASSISATDSAAFEAIHRSIAQVYEGAVVTPFLTVAGTDSRHFEPVCDKIFRFAPLIGEKADLERIHGTNERIGLDTYAQAIELFATVIVNAQEAAL